MGSQVLLSIRKLSVHHPSLRQKFLSRWIGPCRVLELVGSRAARIELPATLSALHIHDVFHFSDLKPYQDSHIAHSEPAMQPSKAQVPQTDDQFEAEAIVDYKRSKITHGTDSYGSQRSGPHFLVRWKGYASDHDMWLPPSELSQCLDKVSEYLFHAASPSQRAAIIQQFPARSRSQLLHMVQRAERTRPASRLSRHMTTPPRAKVRSGRGKVTPRQSPRFQQPQAASAIHPATHCIACQTPIHHHSSVFPWI